MASITSSPSNSQNSATKPRAPSSPSHQPQDAATGNGLPDALEKKTPAVDPFEDMDSGDYIKKFSKYEADYTRRLMAKYFSDKDIYGDNIFDESKTIDGETIKASRWHCAQSYADPVQFLKQKSNCTSITTADTPTTISNGKHPMEDGLKALLKTKVACKPVGKLFLGHKVCIGKVQASIKRMVNMRPPL